MRPQFGNMSLVELGWRRFTFFDREVVTDPEIPSQPFQGLQDLDPVCTSSGAGVVIVGEGNGSVNQILRGWKVDYWKAYKVSLASLCYVAQHNILVTVGEDEVGVNSFIKVWQMTRFKKGNPFCCRVSRSSPSTGRSAKASSVSVHSSLMFTVIGFEDSTLLLYRGDVMREKNSGKPMTIRDGLTCASDGAITGTGFQDLTDGRLVLFVTTTRMVFSYVLRDREVVKKNIHDARGCDARSWALGGHVLDYQFVVARRDMVYFYSPDQCALPDDATNGRCQAFEKDKEKLLVRLMGPYLLLVTKDVAPLDSDNESRMNMLTIYDIPGQYIAYNAPVHEVLDVFAEWGSFFVYTKNPDRPLIRLAEKDIQTKLDVLFRKNLFDVAINLAKRQYCDATELMEIFRKHGDYLYGKGDYDNAVKEYIQTIGNLEPSYVIRKFLDAQRISQLTHYLECLHKQSLATVDHTTILLNCYTKLNDSAKIDRFVSDAAVGNDGRPSQLNFDVDTAIKVLRSSGFTDQALILARRTKNHDMCLYIMLENTHDYHAAIHYIDQLDFHEAEKYMKKYGKALLTEVPTETTQLLKNLCSGSFHCAGGDGPRAVADEFINIFVDNSPRLKEFLEHTSKMDSKSGSHLYNTLLELYLREYFENKTNLTLEEKLMEFLQDPVSKYDLDRALVLAQMYEFGPGLLFLYEKAKLYHEILQYHISLKDYEMVIDTCRRYGEAEKNKEMWVEALWFVARNDDVPIDCVTALLKHVDALNVLPPLMVLEILAHSPTITLGVIKDYLLAWLRHENEQIERDEAIVKTYQQEIATTEAKIEDLKNNPQVFQVSKCSACETQLEVPTVYFLCGHSYHQHCFESYADNDKECPSCQQEHRKLRAKLNARDQTSRDSYQSFKNDVQSSGDCIATVASYFGRGVYSKTGKAPIVNANQTTLPSAKKTLNPFGDEFE